MLLMNQEKAPESQVWESGAGHEGQDASEAYRVAEFRVQNTPFFRQSEIELYRFGYLAELLADRAEMKRERIVYPIGYLHPHDCEFSCLER